MAFRYFGCRPGGPTQEPAFANGESTVVIYFDRVPYPTSGGDVGVETPSQRPRLHQSGLVDGRGSARWVRAGRRGYPSTPAAIMGGA